MIMAVKLFCDWNDHKKDEIIHPQPPHELELIRRGYAGLIPTGIKFVLKEVGIANKESEHAWILLKDNFSSEE
jgi:hypothetical protein